MRLSRTPYLLLAALAAFTLPLESAEAMDPACNATLSHAPGITDPVAGDEAFFKQINPGSNVMLLVDSSGSMRSLPQCDNGGICSPPTIAKPNTPSSTTTPTVAVNGTCEPVTQSATYKVGTVPAPTNAAMVALKWMESVKPKATYADQGFGGQEGVDDLWDCPAWGDGGTGCTTRCSGDGCFYDPNAYYRFPPQVSSGNPNTATRLKVSSSSTTALVASDTTAMVFDNNYAAKRVPGSATNYLDLGPVAQACLKDKGFFIYNAVYPTGISSGNYTYDGSSTNTVIIVRGNFLNGNPNKWVAARRAVKQMLWMTQDSTTGKFDTIRFGLTWFGSTTAGGLVSKLVPGKATLDAAYSKAAFRAARKPMFTHLNNPANNYAGIGATPIGKSLLNVGQYFSQPAAGTTASYFKYVSTASPVKSDWTTNSVNCGGSCSNASFIPAAGAENCAVCYPSCQKNSVILVTDGAPNETEGNSNFPNNILTNGTIATQYATNCPSTCNNAGTFGAGSAPCCPDFSDNAATVPRVAAWLRLYNLWPTVSPSAPVTLTTYAIGFGVSGATQNVLQAVAKMGGSGTAVNATDADTLAAALDTFVSNASMPETSFSAPSVDTLQTTQSSTSDAFLTRFIPNSTNTWEGHVFQAALFDEFGNGCDTTKTVANQTLVPCLASGTDVNPDLDLAVDPVTGKAVCNKVFLVDQSCTPIGENTKDGGFYRLDGSGAVTNVAAVLPWDAGRVLSDRTAFLGRGYRSACQGVGDADAPCRSDQDTPRNIATWLPVGGVMTKVAFTTANVATIQPYLSIEPAWCDRLLTSIAFSPLPATAAAKLTQCAKQIIYFVRGYDIFNSSQANCRGPGHPANVAYNSTSGLGCPGGVAYGLERNRDTDKRTPGLAWKLGDIFHSTPIAAHMPASVLTCDLGYDSQCLTTLHSPASLPQQTRIKDDYVVGGVTMDAWTRYRADQVTRARVVIVGANDGMLHGFNAGTPVSNASLNSPNALGNYLYTDGNGEELWGFIPPDLLPKLSRLTKFGTMDDHQYMVDGPTMIRDIWVDGSNQTTSSLVGQDGVKQYTEFHTIAVVSERSGGNSYTALDVTTPTSPRALWTFPKPGSAEAKQMGYSWTDFSGRPPPIGPVKLALSGAAALAQDPTSRGFEERWVVFINGGYDPTLVRGRAVFMVDAWTGETIWRVTDDDLKTGGLNSLGFGSGTSMSSVPGSVALIDLGDTTRPAFDIDGFFDTATWGDVGGNLWVARFHAPGVVGTSGRVENWFAARSLEQGRVVANTQNARTRQPFFAMTANAYEPTTRTLRSYLGSGNRERLTAEGATCGQNNLIGCCQSGCQVSATVSENLGGTCGWSSTFTCDASGNMSHASVSDTPSACAAGTSCASGTPFTANASVTISGCPGASGPSSATGAISCDSAGTCSSANSTPTFTQLGQGVVAFTGTAPPPPRFFAVWAYGKDRTKMFSTLAEAQTFDQNRFTDSSSYTGTCTSAATSCKLVDTTATTVSYNPLVTNSYTVTGPQATAEDPGWLFQYQGGNEKTGAGATVVLGCTVWSGFVATGITGTSSCTGSSGTLTSRAYLSNFVTGVPSPSCGYADGTSVISRYVESRGVTAPPTTANIRVVVNASGKVEYSALQLAPGGSPSAKSVGTRSQVVEPIYWMEVPRDLHNCRHDAALSASTCK